MDQFAIIMNMFVKGEFADVIVLANEQLSKSTTPIDVAGCYYFIGCSLSEVGQKDSGLCMLLEALNTFPPSEVRLIAHTQDEISRILHSKNLTNSALFFCKMAIENFELCGNFEMKASAESLREALLWKA
jgi:hypothetical protein